jgi:hypothetical protein
MCHEWMQRETEATTRADDEREQQEQPIWEKTTPRGNQEPDDHDLDRGLERLETLVGH